MAHRAPIASARPASNWAWSSGGVVSVRVESVLPLRSTRLRKTAGLALSVCLPLSPPAAVRYLYLLPPSLPPILLTVQHWSGDCLKQPATKQMENSVAWRIECINGALQWW